MKKLVLIFLLALVAGSAIAGNLWGLWQSALPPAGDFPHDASALEYWFPTDANPIVDYSAEAIANPPGSTGTVLLAIYQPPTNGFAGGWVHDGTGDETVIPSSAAIQPPSNCVYTITIDDAGGMVSGDPAWRKELAWRLQRNGASWSWVIVGPGITATYASTNDYDQSEPHIYTFARSPTNSRSYYYIDGTLIGSGLWDAEIAGATSANPLRLASNQGIVDSPVTILHADIYTNVNWTLHDEQTNATKILTRIGLANDIVTNSNADINFFIDYVTFNGEAQSGWADGSLSRAHTISVVAPTTGGTTERGWNYYDGVNDQVSYVAHSGLSIGAGGCLFTVVNMDAFTSQDYIIAKSGFNDVNKEYSLGVYGNDLGWNVSSSGNAGIYNQMTLLNIDHLTNKWVVLAANYDGGLTTNALSIYTNAVEATGLTPSMAGSFTGMVETASTFVLGNNFGGGTFHYKGKIASTFVVQKAGGLTPTEIIDISSDLVTQYEGL